jgi:hypothetical protein
MSRTSPRVLAEMVDSRTYKTDQIVESSGIWSVFFDNQPFNLRITHYLDKDSPPKYRKTSFSNPGHARNLCRKLNLRFKTNKFTVVYLDNGTQVWP